MTGPPRALVLLVLVAAAATASYLGTLGHGFVYDDHRFIEGNARLGFADAFDPAAATADGGEPGMWRPVRGLSYALDRALLGPGPAGMHLSNALLHGVATALVCAVGLALRLGDLAAAAGAAIFGLHPVQAEAVSWISARGDLLCAVLLLGAVLAHLRRVHWLLGAALVGLAFLAKEAAVAAPLLLACADLAAGGAARLRERWRSCAASAAGLAVLVGVRAAVLSAAEIPFGQGTPAVIGPLEKAGDVPSMLAWHAGRVLFPVPVAFDHQLQPSLLLALAALAGVLLLAWLPKPLSGPVRCGAAWALAALVPVTLLQVAFPLKILVADRFLYLALAGPALAAGALAAAHGTATVRGLLVATPFLLLLTLPASARWASDESLWRDCLAREPGHPRAMYGLAVVEEPTRPAEAVRRYRAYVEAVPGDPGAWFRLGLVEERLGLAATDVPTREGHLLGAVAALGEAIRLWLDGEAEGRRKGLLEARLARACVLATLGQGNAAEDEAKEGLRLLRAADDGERKRLRPRVDLLREWAEKVDRGDLAAALEREPRR